ncbi:MAG: peptidyl-prolyl cis-trans isomerase, partial [Pseudomonadota bacterium]
PSEEDLAAYHAENAVRYSAPEYRKAVVALFRREDLLGGIEAPEEELQELYEFRKALYETPETRTVRIATFADEAAARATADRLGAGESFETVVGDAVVTRENVEQGDILDPKVGEAAFSVETGAATEPIDGAFAWSIAKVDAITPATVTPYEDVREALKAEYVADDAEVALYDLIDAFEAARDGGAGVREAAAAAGVDVIEIAAVDAQGLTPDGAPVENVPSAALEEIFTLPLDEISDMTDLNRDGDAFVVVSEDATPSTLRPLEQVRQTVEADWRSDRQEALLRAAAETMVEAARASGGLVKATEAQDRTVLSKTVNRATFDEAFSASFLNQIFNAATGDIAFAPARLGDSFVVAEIAGIVPPSLVGAEAEIARIAEEISNDNGAALIDTYLTALQADYTVRVNQQQLSILFPNEN